MNKDWPGMATELSSAIKEVRLGSPEVMKHFSGMAAAATAGGALDSKVKELLAIAIAVAIRCEGCIVFHARACVRLGVSREEVLEMIGVAVEMGGGPSSVYGASALALFDAMLEAKAGEPGSA